jgi:hypothetical protein
VRAIAHLLVTDEGREAVQIMVLPCLTTIAFFRHECGVRIGQHRRQESHEYLVTWLSDEAEHWTEQHMQVHGYINPPQ